MLISDSLDLANLTCLGHGFFVLSHQVLEEKGRYSPPKTSCSCPTATNPQQSQGFFGYLMCVLTSYLICCANPRLITYPIGSLANANVHVWCLQPIQLSPCPPPFLPTCMTQQCMLIPVPPVTSPGCLLLPHSCPWLPRPAPQHYQFRIKNE